MSTFRYSSFGLFACICLGVFPCVAWSATAPAESVVKSSGPRESSSAPRAEMAPVRPPNFFNEFSPGAGFQPTVIWIPPTRRQREEADRQRNWMFAEQGSPSAAARTAEEVFGVEGFSRGDKGNQNAMSRYVDSQNEKKSANAQQEERADTFDFSLRDKQDEFSRTRDGRDLRSHNISSVAESRRLESGGNRRERLTDVVGANGASTRASEEAKERRENRMNEFRRILEPGRDLETSLGTAREPSRPLSGIAALEPVVKPADPLNAMGAGRSRSAFDEGQSGFAGKSRDGSDDVEARAARKAPQPVYLPFPKRTL